MIGQHAGDLLSALLDGQLDAAEVATVRAHVAECAACSRELEDVRVARRLVRLLPAVEPPASLVAELLAGDVVVPLAPRRRRRVGLLAGAAAAVALLVAGVLSVTSNASPDEVDPEVAVAVERHTSTVGALEAEGAMPRAEEHFPTSASVPPTTAQPLAFEDLGSPFDAPKRLGDYRLVKAYDAGDGVHLLYQSGEYALSIFETPGDLDVDALPGNGTRLRIGGHDAWRSDDLTADGRLYVIDDDGLALVVIGDEPGDAVLEIITELFSSTP